MERQSRTFRGMGTTLADTIDMMAAELSRPIFDDLKFAMQYVLELLGALPTTAEKAAKATADAVEKSISSALSSHSEVDATAVISEATASASEKLDQLQAKIDKVSDKRGFWQTKDPVDLKDSGFVDIEEFDRALGTVEQLEVSLKRLRVAEKVISEEGGAFSLEALEARLARRQAQLDSANEKLKPTSDFSQSGAIGSEGLDSSSRTDPKLKGTVARLETEVSVLTGMIELARTDFDIEQNKLDSLAAERARQKEIDETKAKTLQKTLVDGAERIRKENKLVNDNYELQSATLEEQEQILADRLADLETEKNDQLKLLGIIGSKEAAEIALLDIDSKKKRLLLEILKIQEKSDAKARQEGEDTLDLKVKGEQLTLDSIRHQKGLVAIGGIALNEREEMNDLVKQEKDALQAIIDLRLQELAIVTDPKREAAINSEIQNLKQAKERAGSGDSQRSRFESSIEDFRERDDPENSFDSIKEAGIAAILDFQTQAGTMQNQFYDQIIQIQNTIQGGISDSIEGLINKTMTWADALQNVGNAIGGSIVKAIADMAAAWILNQARMLLFGKTQQAISTATTMAQATALALAWTPAATLASIATFGGATAAGATVPPMVAANTTAVKVLTAVPKMETGGFPQGANAIIQVNENGQEAVLNNMATQAFGAPFIQGMNDGRITPQTIGGGEGGGGGSPPMVNVGIFSNPQDTREWLESQEGESVFVDTYRRKSDELAAS